MHLLYDFHGMRYVTTYVYCNTMTESETAIEHPSRITGLSSRVSSLSAFQFDAVIRVFSGWFCAERLKWLLVGWSAR